MAIVQPAARLASTAFPWTWDADPLVCFLLVVTRAINVAGILRLRRERRLPDAAWPGALAFGAGIASPVVASISPLDAWGDEVFSAHMAQHLILMMLAPPLLVVGRPIVVALWALPRGARHGVAVWWRMSGAIRTAFDFVRRPLVSCWRSACRYGSGICRAPTIWRSRIPSPMHSGICPSS